MTTDAKHTPTPCYYEAGFGEIRFGFPEDVTSTNLPQGSEHFLKIPWKEQGARERLEKTLRALNQHREAIDLAKNMRAYLLEPRAFPSDHVRGMILALGEFITKAESPR